MLEIRGAKVRYGDIIALDEIDLDLADGQVLALLGPSGCGKSTLLRAVAGLEPLSAGTMRWNGQDLSRVPVHRRGFGLMFQDGVLFPHRTVAGNIGYGLKFSPTKRGPAGRRVDYLLDVVGLPGLGDRKVDELSGGQQQRVALARALAPEPKLLLLDEPLAALDASLRARLLDDLRTVLKRTATTALFVTHDQDEAFAIADRLALMRDGRIRQVGTPDQVWRSPVDAWAAEFVGYTSVLPAGHRVGGFPDGPIALRPAALVADPDGRLTAVVRAVRPAPDSIQLAVEVPGIGVLQAISDRTPTIGEELQLRPAPGATAPITPDFPRS